MQFPVLGFVEKGIKQNTKLLKNELLQFTN